MDMVNCVIPKVEGEDIGANIELTVSNLNEDFMVYDE